MADEEPRAQESQPEAEESQAEAEGSGPVLDIGFYISALIALYGVILLVYGAVGSPDNHKTLGHPFDLWWGAVMLAVGIAVGAAALIGKRTAARTEVAPGRPASGETAGG